MFPSGFVKLNFELIDDVKSFIVLNEGLLQIAPKELIFIISLI